MIAQLKRRIEKLEEAVRRLQAIRSPDAITMQTTNGVSRTPIARRGARDLEKPIRVVWQ